jgi:hypothetical protein
MRYRAEGGTLIGVKVTIIIKLAELFDVDAMVTKLAHRSSATLPAPNT